MSIVIINKYKIYLFNDSKYFDNLIFRIIKYELDMLRECYNDKRNNTIVGVILYS